MKLILSIKTFLFITLITISNINFAQNDSAKTKIKTNFSADLFSRYIWRGTQFGGNSPSLQPGITANYKNLEIGTWGAYSIGGNNPAQEMDLFLQYTFLKNKLSVIITDYFFPTETANYNYFDYNKNTTGHIFESGLTFNGTQKIPLTFSSYINIFGADAAKIGDNPNDTTNFNKKTGIQYSNYFELGYTKTITNTELNFFIGFTLNKQKSANTTIGYIGETGFYGNGPGIVNLGLKAQKTIKITKYYSLPLTTSLITNPQAHKVYLIFGISF